MLSSVYKIAEGPLDIRTKQIQVLVNGETNPIIVESFGWDNLAESFPPAVISGTVYSLVIDLGYISQEYIFVCDNAVLNSEIFNFGGEMPFTGIFVSEGIESITIPETEVVHKIDSKYVGAIPSIMFTETINGITIPMYGCNRFITQLGDEPREVPISVSDGSTVLDILGVFSLNDTHEAGRFGRLSIGNSGEITLYPGDTKGTQTELYMMIVGNEGDVSSAKVLPAIITFTTTGGDA